MGRDLALKTPNRCRSELAREELTGTAFIQDARVIVDVFREQARSYNVVGFSPALAIGQQPARNAFDIPRLDNRRVHRMIRTLATTL